MTVFILYLLVCVSREQWRRKKKKETVKLNSCLDEWRVSVVVGLCGREARNKGVTNVLLNVWAYVHACLRTQCRLIHGGRGALVKETSASPLTRLQGGCWRAKPVSRMCILYLCKIILSLIYKWYNSSNLKMIWFGSIVMCSFFVEEKLNCHQAEILNDTSIFS